MSSRPASPAAPSAIHIRERSPFWSLLLLTLNNTFGVSAARFRYFVKKERVWEPILIFIGMATTAGFFIYASYQVSRALVAAGSQIGQPEVAFVFAVLTASAIVFFFGLAAVISVFYFSTDLDILVPLPLRPGAIVLSKFAAILVGEYVAALVMFGPTATAYAQIIGGGVLYWLSVAVVGLLIPVIPLALASVLSLVLMRFINRRHRDLLLVVFSLALLTLIMGFQMSVLSTMPQGDPAEYIQQLLSGQLRLVNLVGRGFPPAVWAAGAIAASGLERLGGFAAYVALSGFAVWLMAAVGARFYYLGLIGGHELARRRVTGRLAELARAGARARTVQGGVLRALFLREWRLFMRVPLYVMNGFIASLIVPILLVVPAFSADPDVERLLALMDSGGPRLFVTLGVGALIVFLVTLNTTASSAVSREGKYFWISKVIPVSPEKQAQGKMLFAGAGALVSTIPVVIILAVGLKVNAVSLAGGTILGLLAAGVLLLAGLFIDMARPMLKWTNPQQAVKSNINVIIPLPIAVALLAGFGYLAVWLHGTVGLTEGVIVAVLGAILGTLLAVAYTATLSAARRLYERLEP